VTLSLWFCASQAGNYNVEVRHSVTSWTGFVTVAAPNAWAYYSFVIPAPGGQAHSQTPSKSLTKMRGCTPVAPGTISVLS